MHRIQSGRAGMESGNLRRESERRGNLHGEPGIKSRELRIVQTKARIERGKLGIEHEERRRSQILAVGVRETVSAAEVFKSRVSLISLTASSTC